MKSRGVYWANFLFVFLVLWLVPSEAWTTTLRVVREGAYQSGPFLVVDAIAENNSSHWVDWAEVSVEFYNFFDKLISLEQTVLRPPILGPGQKGTLRVITPYNDTVRKIRYRFTWWQDSEQFQNLPGEEHLLWR
jgi:hypothetical protein